MQKLTMRGSEVLVCLLTILSAGCAQQGDKKTEKAAEGSESTIMDAPKTVAVIETTLGTLEAELYAEDAPRTVENFIGLVEQKYYDGVTFHRVSRGFVIQGGDPTGTGTGGKTLTGKPLPDELNAMTPSFQAGYLKGVLAMANKGRPGTSSSQFFIMLDNNLRLPKEYTIFGRVIKGMEVVDAIGQVPITPDPRMGPNDGKPVTPVVMKSVRIVRPGPINR